MAAPWTRNRPRGLPFQLTDFGVNVGPGRRVRVHEVLPLHTRPNSQSPVKGGHFGTITDVHGRRFDESVVEPYARDERNRDTGVVPFVLRLDDGPRHPADRVAGLVGLQVHQTGIGCDAQKSWFTGQYVEKDRCGHKENVVDVGVRRAARGHYDGVWHGGRIGFPVLAKAFILDIQVRLVTGDESRADELGGIVHLGLRMTVI